MIRFSKYLVAALAVGGFAAPALAQYPAPYPPQQTYPPQYPQPGYGQPGYSQGYNNNPIQQVIDQLLGNRYNVNDRTAVQRCASAAVVEASRRYRPQNYRQGYNQYGQAVPQQPYGQQYGQGYSSSARVTAITNVERRGNNGLRVSGILDSGRFGAYGDYGNQGYGQGYGYGQQGQAYAYGSPYAAASGDLTFRCNVDYRGAVTNVRLGENRSYRRR